MVRISVGHNGEIGTVYNIGKLTNVNKIAQKKRANPAGSSKGSQKKSDAVIPSYQDSLPQNASKNNMNNAENLSENFVEGEQIDSDILNRVPNAMYSSDGKRIYVNANSKDPIMVSVLHEAVHALRRGNPEAYNRLNTRLKMLVRADTGMFSGVIADIYSRYANSDGKLDNEILNEEFTAKMLSYILDNKVSIKRFARENMNVFQKAQDSILGLIDSNLERYSTLKYGEDSDFAVVAKKLEDYRNEFTDVFMSGTEGYYRNSGYTADGERYSVVNIKGKKGDYGIGVYLDTKYFGNSNSRTWNHKVRNFIKNNLVNKYFTIYDDAGNAENIYFAKEKERIIKDGSKNSRKVIDELAFRNDPIESKSIIHIGEMLSVPYESKSSSEHSHQWLDQKGWDLRYVYVMDVDKNIYKVKLNIANARDGRKILYAVSDTKKIDVGQGQLSSKITSENVPATKPSIYTYSLPRNTSKHNVNIAENLSENFVGNIQNDVDSGNIMTNHIAERIYRREVSRYGLSGVSDEDALNISLARADIDMRLGREFMFEDNSRTSEIKDKLNNSLHLSDTVIFDSGEGANVATGAGRVLGFDENANVVIAVDSGVGFGNTVTVPPGRVTFVSHNTPESIGNDFESSHPMYKRAKNAFESFVRSGNSSELDSFGYSNARYYLASAELKAKTLAIKLQRHLQRDDGIGGHISNHVTDFKDSMPFEFGEMSAHDLLRQYYEAVYNMNLAKNISDIYVSSGAEVLDIEAMIRSVVDKDSWKPSRELKRKGGRSGHAIVNGNYLFNDVYRNFERVFGRYYDVVKPLLDEFDDAKGQYSTNIMSNIASVSDMMKLYGFKAGDDFDKAIQWYGEGSVHFDLGKSKDRRLFDTLGFERANFGMAQEIDVPFGEAELIRFLGEERAEGVRKCSAWFRVAYDTYLKRANEVISRIYPGQTERLIQPRKDYFRHFREVSDNLFSLMFQLSEDIQIDPMLAGVSNLKNP